MNNQQLLTKTGLKKRAMTGFIKRLGGLDISDDEAIAFETGYNAGFHDARKLDKQVKE